LVDRSGKQIRERGSHARLGTCRLGYSAAGLISGSTADVAQYAASRSSSCAVLSRPAGSAAADDGNLDSRKNASADDLAVVFATPSPGRFLATGFTAAAAGQN